MCIVCMQCALPEWERFEAEQRALSERTTSSSRPDEWTRMDDGSGGTDAPALLTADQSEPVLEPQYAGTAQGGTANGVSEGFNQQLVDYLVYRGGDGPF